MWPRPGVSLFLPRSDAQWKSRHFLQVVEALVWGRQGHGGRAPPVPTVPSVAAPICDLSLSPAVSLTRAGSHVTGSLLVAWWWGSQDGYNRASRGFLERPAWQVGLASTDNDFPWGSWVFVTMSTRYCASRILQTHSDWIFFPPTGEAPRSHRK